MLIFLLILGLIGSTFIAISGYFLHAISFSGIFATIFIGTNLALTGNIPIWATVIFLFGSSLVINLIKQVIFPDSLSKETVIHEKNGPRDYFQILANTLPATIFILLYTFTSNNSFLLGSLASLAGATADTWASEIGMLSKRKPIDITTFKPLPTGLSGGVSLLGLIASFFGSLFAVLIFFIFSKLFYQETTTQHLFSIVVLGFFTSLLDSLLGSLFQRTYQTTNNELTEQATGNKLVHGVTWLSNDGVNLIATSCIAVITFLLTN